MVIGNGMIARCFSQYSRVDDVVIFAKGVSDSKEVDPKNFHREQREVEAALERNKDKLFVYFSTCSVYDEENKDSGYVIHKLKMEQLIKDSGSNFSVFRLPQVVGRTNNNTIVNFFKRSILNRQKFTVMKYAKRSLIDIDDVFEICDFFIKNKLFVNDVVNIASKEKISALAIVEILEELIGEKAIYDVMDSGNEYDIDTTSMEMELKQISYNISPVTRILKKYFETSALDSHGLEKWK